MYCKKEQQELVTKILLESMGKVNKQFNLNVTLRIDIEYGDNYAIVH